MSALRKYKKGKYLGKGSYGAAILVGLKADPSQKYVIKEIAIERLNESEREAALMEATVLNQMNHSNITRYIESFVENSKLYIVMEYANGGDLSEAIQRCKKTNARIAEDEVMRIFVQICLALKHVHDRNILHRDLKSSNIFLTTKGIVKLGDFGIAKVLDDSEDQARTQIGTPYYLSPEICESRPYGRQSDIWSLGVVLYELVVLEVPFQGTSLQQLTQRILYFEPNWIPIAKNYSPELLVLSKSLLSKDPTGRPSARDIVKTPLTTVHISELLSHTIKAGRKGGLKAEQPISIIDVEEADAHIERERERMKQEEEQELVAENARQMEEVAKEKMKQQEMSPQDSEQQTPVPGKTDYEHDHEHDQDRAKWWVPSPRVRPLSAVAEEAPNEKPKRSVSDIKASPSPRVSLLPDLPKSPRPAAENRVIEKQALDSDHGRGVIACVLPPVAGAEAAPKSSHGLPAEHSPYIALVARLAEANHSELGPEAIPSLLQENKEKAEKFKARIEAVQRGGGGGIGVGVSDGVRSTQQDEPLGGDPMAIDKHEGVDGRVSEDCEDRLSPDPQLSSSPRLGVQDGQALQELLPKRKGWGRPPRN